MDHTLGTTGQTTPEKGAVDTITSLVTCLLPVSHQWSMWQEVSLLGPQAHPRHPRVLKAQPGGPGATK